MKTPDDFTLETIVFCRDNGTFRILNLNEGVVESIAYQGYDQARASIKDGERVGGQTVKFVAMNDIAFGCSNWL